MGVKIKHFWNIRTFWNVDATQLRRWGALHFLYVIAEKWQNGIVSVAGRILSKTQNLRPSLNFFRGAATVNLSMALHPSSLHLCFDSFVSIYFVFFHSHKIEFENR